MFNKIMEPCLMKSYIFFNLNINKVSIANTVLFFIKNVIDFFSFFSLLSICGKQKFYKGNIYVPKNKTR